MTIKKTLQRKIDNFNSLSAANITPKTQDDLEFDLKCFNNHGNEDFYNYLLINKNSKEEKQCLAFLKEFKIL
jgi:hypothetical protein